MVGCRAFPRLGGLRSEKSLIAATHPASLGGLRHWHLREAAERFDDAGAVVCAKKISEGKRNELSERLLICVKQTIRPAVTQKAEQLAYAGSPWRRMSGVSRSSGSGTGAASPAPAAASPWTSISPASTSAAAAPAAAAAAPSSGASTTRAITSSAGPSPDRAPRISLASATIGDTAATTAWSYPTGPGAPSASGSGSSAGRPRSGLLPPSADISADMSAARADTGPDGDASPMRLPTSLSRSAARAACSDGFPSRHCAL